MPGRSASGAQGTRPVLRLLADDLTGALDTAAEFTALCGPVPVPLRDATPNAGSLAIDSGTREAGRDAAMQTVTRQAGLLAGADIAFRKIDSLLRGQVAAELAACLAPGRWRHGILAPAFPAQGRITRGGVQMQRMPDGGLAPVGDIAALLAAEGLDVVPGRPDAALPTGISLFDAEDDATLARIAALGRAAPGPVLWIGTGGLARALAGDRPVAADTRLAAPVLGLFGSDQAATRRQVAACGPVALRLPDTAIDPAPVAQLMAMRGAAMVALDLPAGLGRAAAAARIAAAFATLVRRLPRPGTLLVAGGATLHDLCRSLGAESLVATGLAMPGVPRSMLRGGVWDGLVLLSKSGAFGGDGLWRDLLAENGLPSGKTVP